MIRKAQYIIKSAEALENIIDEANLSLNEKEKIEKDKLLKENALNKVLLITDSAIGELIRNNGLMPQYALRLTEDGETTADNLLTEREVHQRNFLKNIKFKAVVKFDGKVITSTDYCPIRIPQLVVEFKKQFEFRIIHQPTDITLDIYCKNVSSLHFTETLLSSVSIPFPGQTEQKSNVPSYSVNKGSYQNVAHSFSPNIGWYIFGTNKNLPVSTKTFDWFLGRNNNQLDSFTEVLIITTCKYIYLYYNH